MFPRPAFVTDKLKTLPRSSTCHLDRTSRIVENRSLNVTFHKKKFETKTMIEISPNFTRATSYFRFAKIPITDWKKCSTWRGMARISYRDAVGLPIIVQNVHQRATIRNLPRDSQSKHLTLRITVTNLANFTTRTRSVTREP